MTGSTSSRLKIAIFIQAFIVVVLLVARYMTVVMQATPDDLVRPACAAEVALIGWMAWSWWWVIGTLFDPYMLLVLSASMFHAGQMALEVLGLNRRGFLRGIFPSEIALDAVCMVVLCFAVMHLGALIALTGSRTVRDSSAATNPSRLKDIRMIGWAFFAISFIPAILVYKDMLEGAMTSGYFTALFGAGQAATGIAAYKFVLAEFFPPAALFLLVGSRDKPFARYFSLGMVLFHCGVYLVVGSRGSAFITAVVYAWVWHSLVRPIPKAAILSAGAFAIFIVFPLIGMMRSTGGGSRFSLDAIMEKYESMDDPATAGLQETGGTLGTVAYTIQLVPVAHDYERGRSYAVASFTIFPNLFWDINPGLLGRPAEWLVSVVAPKAAYVGASIGYSFIAEAYFNFGWYGALVLGFIGFCVARMVRWIRDDPDPLVYGCVANIVMPLFWYTRNEATGIFRGIVWYGICPYILVYLLSATRRRSRRASLPPLPEPAFMERIARCEARRVR